MLWPQSLMYCVGETNYRNSGTWKDHYLSKESYNASFCINRERLISLKEK